MAGFTDYFEEKLLEHAFSEVPYTPPAQWYVTVFTATPTDAGGGTEMAGGSWGGRQPIDFGQYAAGGVPSSLEVGFTMAAGTIVAVGIVDTQAAGTGNLCSYKEIAPKTYTDGEPVIIAVGDLIQTLD